jgi:hypothetical protein
MENIERRKYPRVQIYDPISYQCLDSKGDLLDQNIGVARNISQDGIQIETYKEVDAEFLLLMFIDLNKNVIEIKGQAIYCLKKESGQFKTGIRLKGTPKEKIQFVKALIKYYHHNNEESRLVISS